MMLLVKALMVASLLGGVRSWNVDVPRPDHTAPAEVARKWLIMMAYPELYYLREANVGPDPISFTKQKIVSEIANVTEVPIIITTPTLTSPPIRSTPSLHDDDPAEYWSRDLPPDIDFSEHLVTLVKRLLMGAVLLILLVLYCTIIKPVHFVLSHFTDPGHVGELHDFLTLIAEYKCATFFWLAVILYRPVVKPFMRSILTIVDSKKDLEIRLSMAEGRIHDHSILLQALVRDMQMCKEGLDYLGNKMNTFQDCFNDLVVFIDQEAPPMVLELVRFEIANLTARFNQEAKGFTYRAQRLESELKALIASNDAKDEEIKGLKAALRQTQASASKETLRRGGNPANPSPMRRVQKVPYNMPGGHPSSTPGASSSSFSLNSSPNSFSFSAVPVSFTAGGSSGGAAPGGSAPSVSTSSALVIYKGE